jgi:hypothetical protein
MKDEMYKVPILTDLSESDKASTIDQFVRMTAKYTLQMFMMLGLKTHIEAKIVNEPTKEEFIFSFKKVETTSLPSSDNVKSAELDDLKQYVTNLLYYAFSFNGPTKVTDEFDKWVEEKTNELEEYYSQLPNKEGCSHVLGAADESGKCFKCGETVSITTRYEKREG